MKSDSGKPIVATARILTELHRQGYTASAVKHWNPWARHRFSVFGFLDILAVKPGEPGVLGIRCRRVQKTHELNLRAWLRSGNRFEIWDKREAHGEQKVAVVDRRFIEVANG